ncbi:hypothetical protein ACQ4PT_045943 [Festuca glaucescens]
MSYKRPQLHFILLLLLAYYFATRTAANGGITVQCLPDQAVSLLQLKRSFYNPNLSSWQQGTDCCHWEGVRCDRASGQVITLDLSDRNLESNGGLSPALFNLTSLTNLSLSGNDFGSTILPNFGFERLTSLDLSNARLFGQIPTGGAHLKNLRTLDLSYNNMYLQEPSFQALVADMSSPRELYLDTVGILSNEATWSVGLADSVPLLQDISLYECGLSGPIHHSFSLLRFLATINLGYCGLSGHVPRFFAEFSFLRYLDLSANDFEGQFPTKIFQLEKLRYLDVSYNPSLSGKLPDFPPGNILESLNLRDTNFSGAIPDSFVHLKSLEFLGLSNVGSPKKPTTSIANLTSLNTLWLSGSGIEKPMLSWVGRLKNLTDLRLKDYTLSGPIPWWIRNYPSSSFLYFIDLSINSLNGHIPKSFFDLTGLETLWLGSNQFKGTVELSLLWKLRALGSLDLSNNMLSVIDVEDGYPIPYLHKITQLRLISCNLTKIPVALKYANEMYVLDLSSNRIDGAIPSWMWMNWKDSISTLNLSNNMFTSLQNSPSVIHVNNLDSLDLSSNKLHGSVPIPLTGTAARSAVMLDYSNNSFSSIIPDFGRVPPCLTQGSSLVMLKLRENQFRGVLPENIGEGCMLQTIDMNSNQIEGKIPRSLSNCRSLEVLDIGSNKILDSFPYWMGKMPNLRILILRSNQFYGSIGGPTESDAISKHFSGLQIIDLASNNFSGSLNSKWFGKLETMKANSNGEGNVLSFDESIPGGYYQESLTFKGIDLTFTKILSTFKMIDFSNNAFDGPIPESIGKLIALHGLNMSHNAFCGGIPSKLGDLAQLESLDLCRNKLSGAIPQELATLTYLAVLNLSYNDLTGMIPQGPQFSLFTNSSFKAIKLKCAPRQSGRIEKQKQSRKDATTQELLARVLGVLKENAEFDDNALTAFIDKFKTPLSPRSIAMFGSLVKNVEKVKKPKGNKVGAKKKAVEIT